MSISNVKQQGFAPFVLPELIESFEEHAYGVYEKLGWPNTTGYSSFGRGIWGQKKNGTETVRYHDTTGDTTYDSPNHLLTPLFRTDEGVHKVLMFNTHSGRIQGEATDRLIACAKEREAAYSRGDTSLLERESSCGTITDLFPVVKQGGRWGAAMLRPVHPVNDPLKASTDVK